MNKKLMKHIYLVLLGMLSILVVHFYPVVDWVSKPFYTYFVMTPILVIEMVLFLILGVLKKYESLKKVQIIFTTVLFLIMVYYLFVH